MTRRTNLQFHIRDVFLAATVFGVSLGLGLTGLRFVKDETRFAAFMIGVTVVLFAFGAGLGCLLSAWLAVGSANKFLPDSTVETKFAKGKRDLFTPWTMVLIALLGLLLAMLASPLRHAPQDGQSIQHPMPPPTHTSPHISQPTTRA